MTKGEIDKYDVKGAFFLGCKFPEGNHPASLSPSSTHFVFIPFFIFPLLFLFLPSPLLTAEKHNNNK